MAYEIQRRTLLQMLGIGAASAGVMGGSLKVLAADGDSVTIGWPNDVPSWDPNLRFAPDAQPLYKQVFSQPLTQNPDLSLAPNLITKWEMADDGMSFAFEIRDDVTFQNGDKMTTEDFRFSFVERKNSDLPLDIKNSWRNLTDIEIESPTKATMKFAKPATTVPQWLTFLGSYVVPKGYITEVGEKAFAEKPIGTGPYRLVDYQLNSRAVMERYDGFWGPKPAIKRVIFEIIKDPSARGAAVKSGQVDLTINVPVREVERYESDPNLVGEINPIARLILLQCRADQGFTDQNVRLAAHHAINKEALSKAFYGGKAVPVPVPATPGSPGYVEGFEFPYDPEKAKELLAESGYGPDNPAKITFGTTNGHFPSDYDMARAIQQMWSQVGIDAELQTVEYTKYFELVRSGTLPDAMLYSWDNATGDPEIYAGYLLNPNMPFSAFKLAEFGETLDGLFAETDYEKRIQGYRDFEVRAVEMGATIPILQTVQTLVHKKGLSYEKFQNGWVLANTMKWT
ncbi:ABC transporter substrate-binding protein [Amorphus orientalis]|uniref:Peptide/nickel transport system substrate-binding protein n=1 Tax=Amorphus orientalis TaxID=649198 RepID=A0AAE3VLI4_9HYPH|nr:ABC transporter substrate-binding protein [Amorphus orientalis]MDQ0313851.1 peptide/nickel transport system substrate-binding protein [Amorphus orientalis]